jgi:hypothetical protein
MALAFMATTLFLPGACLAKLPEEHDLTMAAGRRDKKETIDLRSEFCPRIVSIGDALPPSGIFRIRSFVEATDPGAYKG